MLKKEIQIKYFEERMDFMTDHFYNFLLTRDSPELHGLRIELKKIKSLINLSKFCRKNSNISGQFKQLKKVFKAAGLIRSTDINKLNVKKYQKNDSISDIEHANLMDVYCSEFITKSYKYEKQIKTSFKKIAKSFQNIKNNCIEEFFINHLQNIAGLFLQDEPEKNFHKCRKMIKDLIYISEYTSQLLSNKMVINTFYLSILEDQIGKWHDSILTLGFLKNVKIADIEIKKHLVNKIDTLSHSIKSFSENFYEKTIFKVVK